MSENLAPLIDRLRGKVVLAVDDGLGPLDGSDFFERQFPTSRLALEAADRIEALEARECAICRDEPYWREAYYELLREQSERPTQQEFDHWLDNAYRRKPVEFDTSDMHDAFNAGWGRSYLATKSGVASPLNLAARSLYAALKAMSEYWAYALDKPDDAQPTADDNWRVIALANDAATALAVYETTVLGVQTYAIPNTDERGAVIMPEPKS